MESIEVGYRASRGNLSYTLAAYYMQKDNVIFQDSGRNNVSGGATKHRGLELNTQYNINEAWSFSLTASYARHTYDSNVAPRGVSVLAGWQGYRHGTEADRQCQVELADEQQQQHEPGMGAHGALLFGMNPTCSNTKAMTC